MNKFYELLPVGNSDILAITIKNTEEGIVRSLQQVKSKYFLSNKGVYLIVYDSGYFIGITDNFREFISGVEDAEILNVTFITYKREEGIKSTLEIKNAQTLLMEMIISEKIKLVGDFVEPKVEIEEEIEIIKEPKNDSKFNNNFENWVRGNSLSRKNNSHKIFRGLGELFNPGETNKIEHEIFNFVPKQDIFRQSYENQQMFDKESCKFFLFEWLYKSRTMRKLEIAILGKWRKNTFTSTTLYRMGIKTTQISMGSMWRLKETQAKALIDDFVEKFWNANISKNKTKIKIENTYSKKILRSASKIDSSKMINNKNLRRIEHKIFNFVPKQDSIVKSYENQQMFKKETCKFFLFEWLYNGVKMRYIEEEILGKWAHNQYTSFTLYNLGIKTTMQSMGKLSNLESKYALKIINEFVEDFFNQNNL